MNSINSINLSGLKPKADRLSGTSTSDIEVPDSLSASQLPLSEGQQAAYDAVLSGKNAFINGPAGVGKSFVLERIIKDLRAKGKVVSVTASTGIAAVRIGGTTIHSYLGTGTADSILLLQKRKLSAKNDDRLVERLTKTDVLVIDEISMLSGYYIDMMGYWLSRVRKSAKPFGGVQIVASGDFLQLSPVIDNKAHVRKVFAFQSDLWRANPFFKVDLTHNFRQEDGEFRRHLLLLRRGIVEQEQVDFFSPCVGRGAVEPTKLFATNSQVFRVNEEKLESLPGPIVTYECEMDGIEKFFETLAKSCIAEPILRLKVGAPVLILRNDPRPERLYQNGTRAVVKECAPDYISVSLPCGRVVSWKADEKGAGGRAAWEIRDHNDKVLASLTQYPVKLAFSITIHKAQGMTLDCAYVDLSNTFAAGQSYVAMSRVRTLEGLSLEVPVSPSQFMVNQDARAFMNRKPPRRL